LSVDENNIQGNRNWDVVGGNTVQLSGHTRGQRGGGVAGSWKRTKCGGRNYNHPRGLSSIEHEDRGARITSLKKLYVEVTVRWKRGNGRESRGLIVVWDPRGAVKEQTLLIATQKKTLVGLQRCREEESASKGLFDMSTPISVVDRGGGAKTQG